VTALHHSHLDGGKEKRYTGGHKKSVCYARGPTISEDATNERKEGLELEPAQPRKKTREIREESWSKHLTGKRKILEATLQPS